MRTTHIIRRTALHNAGRRSSFEVLHPRVVLSITWEKEVGEMVTRQASGNRRPSSRPQTKSKKKLNPVPMFIGGAILAILAIILTGVLWVNANPATGGEPRSACLLLVDKTSSAAQSAALPEKYQSMANKTIDGCGERSAAMIIASFDQNGTSIKVADYGDNDDAIFSLYPSRSRTDRKGVQQLNDQTLAARETVAELLSTPTRKNRNSDILNALDQAAIQLRLLAKDASVSTLYLTVLTDGFQISDSYSFASFSENGSTQSYLTDVTAARARTDLAGIQVGFAGVDTGASADGAQVPSWFVNQVAEFWIAYIETSGGSLCFYGPDSLGLPVDC